MLPQIVASVTISALFTSFSAILIILLNYTLTIAWMIQRIVTWKVPSEDGELVSVLNFKEKPFFCAALIVAAIFTIIYWIVIMVKVI